MTTLNPKHEAQRSAEFIANLQVVNEGLREGIRAYDERNALTDVEAMDAIKHSGKLFRELAKSNVAPPFMLVPLCVLFAIAHIHPTLGAQFARMCEARLLYSALQYDHCEAGVHANMMRHYTKGTNLSMHLNTISKGNANTQTYLAAMQSIVTAIVAESIFEKIDYKPEHLYKEFYMLNDRHGVILIKWMQSCDIPIANDK